MNIAKKLFRPLKEVSISKADIKRLAPHLSCSGNVKELLVLDTVSTEDLQRMLLLEWTGAYSRERRPRYDIVRKIIARIVSRERNRMINEIYGTAHS